MCACVCVCVCPETVSAVLEFTFCSYCNHNHFTCLDVCICVFDVVECNPPMHINIHEVYKSSVASGTLSSSQAINKTKFRHIDRLRTARISLERGDWIALLLNRDI